MGNACWQSVAAIVGKYLAERRATPGKPKTGSKKTMAAHTRALTAILLAGGAVGIICAGMLAKPITAAAQDNLQEISPSSCDYRVATDYGCTLPPGSTIKLPMSAPAVTPPPGWHCIAGQPPTGIVYYHEPSVDAGITITWVPQQGSACGKISGYALVTVAANARPQYLATDFFLGNDVGECQDGTGICANGIADNGTRWSLDISLPPYVISFHQQVATKDFPSGTTPYTFTDYPPATSTPGTSAATVTCNTTTKIVPSQGQFSYSTSVMCSSKNGIVGSVNYAIQRAWPDRVDYIPGPVYQCNAQQTCQTPATTFKTYGNFPGVYTVSTFVNLLNPINDEGLPGNVIQYGGANYQMVPYNNTQTPYPLVNPDGWQGQHVPFPDTERLFNFVNCPADAQGSAARPQCSAYNTPQLRVNTIAAYNSKGYRVPKGVTANSSGKYITQYIKPIECGGGVQGSNGAFLQPGQASAFASWWNDFSPCAPAPPSVSWQTPKPAFTKYIGDTLNLSVAAVSATASPVVTFRATYPGYTDPSDKQNHWFTIAAATKSSSGIYHYHWKLALPNGQPIPAGQLTIMATACNGQDNCTSSAITGQIRTRYLLFALGLSTNYDASKSPATGFSDMQKHLLQAYPGATSGVYLYPCNNGGCNGRNYSTADTCTNTISEDITALDDQIRAYAAAHTDTDVYVIGDSLGGVTAYGYLAGLRAQHWPSLPGGNKVKGVVTVDAPLGGVPVIDLPAVTRIFNFQCFSPADALDPKPIAPLTELAQVPNPDSGASGGTALLAPYLFPSLTANISNDKLNRDASAQGVRILSIGNLKDYGFAISQSYCAPLLGQTVDLLGSQFVDEQAPWGVYSRFISLGLPSHSCAGDIKNQVNHGVAMAEPVVEAGVANFIAGKAPQPLPVY